ncbi:MAG: SBBP repeat-containing protein [Ignavibacteria bacterium]
MNKLIITIFSVLVYVTQSFSIGQEWATRYNGAGNSTDWAYAIATDPGGNVVVTGYSTGAGTGKDYKTIKYNPLGAILWEATYNGPINGGDYSNAIAIDASGNIFITGRVDFGSADIVTIKYNSSGVQQWAARYNGPANGFDEGKSIHIATDGSIIVGGKTTETASGIDFITIKYNPDGTQAWATTYNGTGNSDDYVVSVDIDNSNNIYAGGCSIGSNSGLDIAVVKYNSSGVQQWVKRYNGSGNGGDALVGLKVDGAGNVIACGSTDFGASQKFNFLTLKYDPSGSLIWEKQYNGTSSDIDLATAMTVDALNNIYLTGFTTQVSGTVLDSNYGTLKYDPNGNLLWVAIYNGPSNSVDVSRSVFVDNSMNVYITGSSKGAGSDDYATIKYSPSGSETWIMSYNGTGNQNDYSSSVVADDNGNAYVTGRSTGANSDYDYATLKYGDLVGIEPVNNQVPDKFSLSQNYPNPFNPSTRIKFSIPEQQNVAIKIFDAIGREVKNIAFGNLSPAVYEYNLNAADLTSGIYYYRIITDRFTDSRKMILVK